jgi:hypothetical protein
MILLTSLTSSFSTASETSPPSPLFSSSSSPSSRLDSSSPTEALSLAALAAALAEPLVDRQAQVVAGGDAQGHARALEHLADDAAAGDALRIQRHHHQAVLAVFQRQPAVLLDVLLLQVAQQFDRLDAVRLGTARRAGRNSWTGPGRWPRAHPVLFDQHGLELDVAVARGARGLFQLGGRQHRFLHQGVVLAARALRFQALAEGHRQGFAQLLHAFHAATGGKGPPPLVVDELDHAQQLAVPRDQRRHQHLAGAVAGALVDAALELQLGREPAQLGVVVDVGDVHGLARRRDEAGHRSRRRSAAAGRGTRSGRS